MASGKGTNTSPAATSTSASVAPAAGAGQEGQRGALADAAATATASLDRHNIRFDASCESAYHSMMEGALDRWHRIIMAIVIVSGTASMGAVASLIPSEWAGVVSSIAPLVVVLVSTLDFVFDLPGQARLHRDIKGKMHEVLAELETCGDRELPKVRAKMQRVYALQPPSLRYAQALAYNIAVDASYPRQEAGEHYEPIPHMALNPLAWVMRVDRSWVKRARADASAAKAAASVGTAGPSTSSDA